MRGELRSLTAMPRALPPLPEPILDAVEDIDGFSAELRIELELPLEDVEVFASVIDRIPPVSRAEGKRTYRGMATIDEDTLWVYVHTTGPGRCDQGAWDGSRALAAELWNSIDAVLATH